MLMVEGPFPPASVARRSPPQRRVRAVRKGTGSTGTPGAHAVPPAPRASSQLQRRRGTTRAECTTLTTTPPFPAWSAKRHAQQPGDTLGRSIFLRLLHRGIYAECPLDVIPQFRIKQLNPSRKGRKNAPAAGNAPARNAQKNTSTNELRGQCLALPHNECMPELQCNVHATAYNPPTVSNRTNQAAQYRHRDRAAGTWRRLAGVCTTKRHAVGGGHVEPPGVGS